MQVRFISGDGKTFGGHKNRSFSIKIGVLRWEGNLIPTRVVCDRLRQNSLSVSSIIDGWRRGIHFGDGNRTFFIAVVDNLL
ncbi:MAG: hypothetical protein ACD_75C02428G0006 [uncultured bacterium]|nr:MAG: hypothetical protein ACD_75C02428G0006 [uncultured bacterium]